MCVGRHTLCVCVCVCVCCENISSFVMSAWPKEVGVPASYSHITRDILVACCVRGRVYVSAVISVGGNEWAGRHAP